MVDTILRKGMTVADALKTASTLDEAD